MNEIQQAEIVLLYLLAREEDAAAVTSIQKQAVEQLKQLSRSGNPDAVLALSRLARQPDMHPLLREVLAA